jgi:hypothetical protein
MRTTDRRKRDREANRTLQGLLETERSLRTVQRMPRTRLEPGVIAWAHIPFEDNDSWKLRPVVIIEARGRSVRIRPITGALSRLRHDRYLEIDDLRSARLDRPCAVSLRREIDLDVIDLVSLRGTLSAGDYLRLQVAEAFLPFVDLPSLGVARSHLRSHLRSARTVGHRPSDAMAMDAR